MYIDTKNVCHIHLETPALDIQMTLNASFVPDYIFFYNIDPFLTQKTTVFIITFSDDYIHSRDCALPKDTVSRTENWYRYMQMCV